VRIAVIDSSSLINLTHLGLAEQLPQFFDLVYVPSAVQREVNRKSRFRYRLNKLYRTGFFRRCSAADKTNVRLLLSDLDEGESQALIQAQKKAALFFVGDEKRAREVAQAMGRKPVGTLRLLARLNLQGQASDLRTLVDKLRRDVGFRVSKEIVAQAIAMAPEPI
jgi:hypothetical protein